jgi:hypothetical protein
MVSWILIASTGNQKYLQATLDSIIWPDVKVIVSLYNIDSVRKVFPEKPNFTFIYRDKPLFQFDHYELLAQELPIADDDRVMLLDDDDLLLPNAWQDPGGSYIGKQVLVESPSCADVALVPPEEIERHCHHHRIVTDLSGTTTSGKHYKRYFQQREALVKMLEDTTYMRYLEKQDDLLVRKDVFVVHRLKEEPSLWMKLLRI